MNRHEREAYDAALDGLHCLEMGSLCPVCGTDRPAGHGPCSTTCELALERAEWRAEIREEWAEDAANDDEDEEPAWMATGGE